MLRDFLKWHSDTRKIVDDRQMSPEILESQGLSARQLAGTLLPSPVPMHSQSGVALVLVLACLTLLTVVVISLMVGATQELNASKSYSEQVEARRLAASTLELVKGQIWAATTEATNSSWASQPGAIRTFTSGNTNLVNVYKLYSSDAMVVPNSSYTNLANEVPANWASRPNEFVDLNRPVVVVAGGSTNTNYPIFNPAATNSVAGFTVTSAPGATTTNPLPMPVQWIYVLRDGTHTNSSVTNAAFNAANPVVGRIAFWTDDDTCKLNINTASATREGEATGGKATQSFWDIPVGSATFENDGLALYQPAQGEFQRYPGHPARVNLKTVLPTITASNIYSMTPRISSADETVGSFGGTKAPSGVIPKNTNRLYATVDEFFYNPSRSVNNSALTSTTLNQLEGLLTAYNRAPELNLFGRPRVSMWPVSNLDAKRTPTDKYFARCSTMVYGNGTSSNLFAVTRSDSTTTNGDLNCTGATIPKLFTYLQNQTKDAPPGYSSSFLNKYTAAGCDQLITLSLDYIRCINLYDSSVTTGNLKIGNANTSPMIPYNANAFAPGDASVAGVDPALYGASIFHLPGFGQVVPLQIGNYRGLGRMDTTISEAALHFWALSWNNGDPVRADDVVTLNGVTQQVSQFNYSDNTKNYWLHLANTAGPNTGGNGTGAPMYAAQLILAPFGPMAGFTRYSPDYLHKVTGLSGIKINGIYPFPAASDGVNLVRTSISGHFGTVSGGASGGMETLTFSKGKSGYITDGKAVLYSNSSLSNPSFTDYPFASMPFAVSANQTSIQVDGGPLTVEIYTKGQDLLQKIDLNFPQTTIKVPNRYATKSGIGDSTNPGNPCFDPLYPDQTCPVINSVLGGASGKRSSGRRMRSVSIDPDDVFYTGDVIISVEATGSAMDYRWLSLKKDVPSSLFQKHLLYDSQVNRACGLVRATGSTNGRYLAASYPNGSRSAPLISSQTATIGVKNAKNSPPDFENGFGDFRDGAYARKPDGIEYIRASQIGNYTPYYLGAFGAWGEVGGSTYFAPNRQVPSPGIMGALPSRATDSDGVWETLLFCPNPAAGTTASVHRGFDSPPDYLWMDLFTMPIVEPYAISEPFSTAGKINMNYQIVPFTYVTRNTGLRAVLAANRVSTCKAAANTTERFQINPDETLKHFQAVFDTTGVAKRVFKSPSEICSMWLYPGQTNAPTPPQTSSTDTPGSNSNIRTWWGYGSTSSTSRVFTGDNLREQPYTALYQNLTTQANTYTVHVYVQALDQTPLGKLIVSGEYRGSYALERFLDPKDPRLPDFTSATSPNAMGYYQFRVNNTTQFLP
jgi:hypothetical protein